MSLFAKVVNNEVTQVWDTQPPAGESGWKSAVEVKPAITANRQSYDGHTFDISVDPVQIVYAVKDITVDDRKGSLIDAAKSTYQQAANEQARLEADDASGDPAAVSTAKDVKDASIVAINACTTHEHLDAL
jgi:hypothetical protein|tara:strand:- start:30 stop:422 length:393 start_codon:yes stop_codon:yes gene_type:complete